VVHALPRYFWSIMGLFFERCDNEGNLWNYADVGKDYDWDGVCGPTHGEYSHYQFKVLLQLILFNNIVLIISWTVGHRKKYQAPNKLGRACSRGSLPDKSYLRRGRCGIARGSTWVIVLQGTLVHFSALRISPCVASRRMSTLFRTSRDP